MSLENNVPRAHTRPRRPKRPSIRTMLAAATKAGLEITSIEWDETGVRLICGTQVRRLESEEVRLDRLMTEQMGVARIGGHKRS